MADICSGTILTFFCGGGGATPGIDDVLAVGQALTTDRTIDVGNNVFNIDTIDTIGIGDVSGGGNFTSLFIFDNVGFGTISAFATSIQFSAVDIRMSGAFVGASKLGFQTIDSVSQSIGVNGFIDILAPTAAANGNLNQINVPSTALDGQRIFINVSDVTNPVTITPGVGDTINGSAAALLINRTGLWIFCADDITNDWTAVELTGVAVGSGGIYEGSGTVPAGAIATITNTLEFGTDLVYMSESSNQVGIGTSSFAGSERMRVLGTLRAQVVDVDNEGKINSQSGQGLQLTANVSGTDVLLRGNAGGAYTMVRIDGATGKFEHNETNRAGADFQVNGDTRDSVFFVDAGTENVGINTNAPAANLEIETPSSPAQGDSQLLIDDSASDGEVSIEQESSTANNYLPNVRGASDGEDGYGMLITGQMPTANDALPGSLPNNSAAIVIKAERTDGTDLQTANVFCVRNDDEPAVLVNQELNLRTFGGRIVKRTFSTAGNYTVLTDDYIIAKTGITGGGDTVTLPSGATNGQVFVIKDESGNAGTDNITIATAGAETIDGAATRVISANYGTVTVYFNGSNYFIIAT